MKRFLVFGYDQYYPCGGWHDLVDRFETLEEAQEQVRKSKKDFRYGTLDIVDLEAGSIVE